MRRSDELSDLAYFLHLTRRALARTDAELLGRRRFYEIRARELAQRLIGEGA